MKYEKIYKLLKSESQEDKLLGFEILRKLNEAEIVEFFEIYNVPQRNLRPKERISYCIPDCHIDYISLNLNLFIYVKLENLYLGLFLGKIYLDNFEENNHTKKQVLDRGAKITYLT